jgi:hypothetical protein
MIWDRHSNHTSLYRSRDDNKPCLTKEMYSDHEAMLYTWYAHFSPSTSDATTKQAWHQISHTYYSDSPLKSRLQEQNCKEAKRKWTTTPNRIRKWSPTLLLTGRYPGCLRRSDGMRNFLDSMVVDEWRNRIVFMILDNLITAKDLSCHSKGMRSYLWYYANHSESRGD